MGKQVEKTPSYTCTKKHTHAYTCTRMFSIGQHACLEEGQRVCDLQTRIALISTNVNTSCRTILSFQVSTTGVTSFATVTHYRILKCNEKKTRCRTLMHQSRPEIANPKSNEVLDLNLRKLLYPAKKPMGLILPVIPR